MFKLLINVTSRINYYSRIKATLSISNRKYPSFPSQSSDLFQKRIWMVFTNSKIRNNSWDEKKSSLKVHKYIQDYKPQSGISVIPSTQNHVLKVLGFGHLSNKQQKTKYNYVFNNIEVIIFFSLSTSGLHLQDRNKFHHFNYAKHQMIWLRWPKQVLESPESGLERHECSWYVQNQEREL